MRKIKVMQMTIFDVPLPKKEMMFPALNTFPTLGDLINMHNGIDFYEATYPFQNIEGKTFPQIKGLSFVKSGNHGGWKFLTAWKKVICLN